MSLYTKIHTPSTLRLPSSHRKETPLDIPLDGVLKVKFYLGPLCSLFERNTIG